MIPTPARLHKRDLLSDRATEKRLAWLQHVMREAFGVRPLDCRPSALMRRAVECYAEHVDSLVRGTGNAMHDELRGRVEVSSLRRANEGMADLDVRIGELTGLPVRPLSVILKERRAARPRPIDLLRADVAHWSKQREEED
jgi:hypothetical protein